MAKSTTKAKVAAAVPSILAFHRKIEPSDALMRSGLWQNMNDPTLWADVVLHEKRNRGTKSQYGVSDAEKHQSNPVWVHDANLPYNADTLKLEFTVKFLGNIAEPTTHNRPDFEDKLKSAVEGYEATFGYQELAKRYVYNLANGRFLWRNRLGVSQISVHVEREATGQKWIFDHAEQLSLNHFDGKDAQIDEISALVAQSFQTGQFLLLKITAFARLGEGQHVFPSQEMIMDTSRNFKTKYLYQIPTDQGLCAAMHSEKIGNAIRTIDTWYDKSIRMPIAVEPYGSVPSRGDAYRKSKNDFYTLLINWLDGEEIADEEKHFVIAILIRGGVFGGND